MPDTANERIVKFQALLRELFQFDSADLDFGIYRIMNRKRGVIERFISTDLPGAIDAELRSGALARQAEAAAALEETRQRLVDGLGAGALDPEGGVANSDLMNTPLAQAYLQAREFAGAARSHATVEADVYNRLHAFFARYYRDGDFISKRRYGRGARYAIPYNGEEVYLHWANRDQYYIKTAEHFHNYDWRAGNGVAVHFRLDNADVEQNNVKGANRFFIPRADDARWDPERRVVTVPFAYRPLTAAEEKTYGRGGANRQDKIAAVAAEALAVRFDAPEAQAALSAGPAADGEPAPVERHLRRYARRNDSDFFIHRELREFLSRELDFYLKNEVLNLDNLSVAGERAADGWFQALRVMKSIGGRIIDFLAQIEDFQKMLWEKRKFVTETAWCVALRCIPPAFHPEIAANDAQWAEWRALSVIDDDAALLANGAKTRDERLAFLKENPTAMVDTARFDADFADRLLASFGDLDAAADGLLVHGENWQALRLLQERYERRIKCIYIDPPYNTAASEIIYKNGYKHSSWLTFMSNRLAAAQIYLDPEAPWVVAIDDTEMVGLCQLLDSAFATYDRNTVIVKHHPGGSGLEGSNVSGTHEYALFMSPQGRKVIRGKRRGDGTTKVGFQRSGAATSNMRVGRPNSFYAILIDPTNSTIMGFEPPPALGDDYPKEDTSDGYIRVYPVSRDGTERVWRRSYAKVADCLEHGEIVCENNNSIYLLSDNNGKHRPIFSIWDDSKYNAGLHGTNVLKDIVADGESFSYPKSVYTVKDCISACVHNVDEADEPVVLDYFAGSGTTGHAVIDLNRKDSGQRKFVLIEMAEYFDTVLLPRIKKISFAPEWKNGKPLSGTTPDDADRSPRIVKYIRIESYEDAMDCIQFDESVAQQNLDRRIEGYFLNYMLKWETKDSETLLNPAKLTDPFAYRLRVRANGNALERPVDVAETFNYLLGLRVRTRRVYMDDDRRYLVFRGETRAAPGRVTVVIWRATAGWAEADFGRDKRFVAETKIAEGADDIYVNGDSCILGARPVEPLFKARMFAGAADGL